MSRSIHETRKMLRDTHREEWACHEEQEARISDLNAKMKRKRQVKDQINADHQSRRMLQAAEEITINSDPAAIPINIEDEGPFIHYPATPDDLRAVMLRLPGGVCDGITAIELALGAKAPPTEWAATQEHKPDPYTGRISGEKLPDVWAKAYFGEYLENDARIRLYAYVYPPDLKRREIKEFLLKLRMLLGLIHEVAHHHNFTRRQGRGRWIMEEGHECQNYAREMTHDWLHQVVVPYLEETYPEETRRLIEWVEYNGGIRLTLDQMAGDPRRCVFNIMETLFFLIEWVEEDEDEDTRYRFADFIHMCGFYEEALKIIDTLLLEEDPDASWLLRLRAHIIGEQGYILLHEGKRDAGRERLSQARELALQVIAEDPEYADAWQELWVACEGLELWDEVIRAATRQFELQGSDLNLDYGPLGPRIRARIALGDFAGAEADIRLLEQNPHEYVREKVATKYRLKLMQATAQIQKTPHSLKGEHES